jgi:NarL family two-component system response regulator LiaR
MPIELTRREQQVAALVAQGRTNAEIADALSVSATTAKWHVSEILRKLCMRGHVQLAVYARDQGLSP